jgi:galactose-1-phosphate uridylyltransferase
MSKSRLGKSRDSIFAQKNVETVTADAPKEKQSRGRPLEHKEGWSKVTVVLLDKQIHWLDKLALDIRQNTKASVSRAEIIRGLISAIEESGIDLTKIENEKDIKEYVVNKLTK